MIRTTSGYSRRTIPKSVAPSISGILMSEMITSIGCVRRISSAWSPLSARWIADGPVME
ncbi:MAG: hypothetical protein R3E12_00555 [Candidatus Eisenbacteria bacterium]